MHVKTHLLLGPPRLRYHPNHSLPFQDGCDKLDQLPQAQSKFSADGELVALCKWNAAIMAGKSETGGTATVGHFLSGGNGQMHTDVIVFTTIGHDRRRV